MRMFDLLVQRKGIDPTAETCLHALRDIMQAGVTGVERGTLWRFAFAGDDSWTDAMRQQIERAASRAGRYVNVNRDRSIWKRDATTPSSSGRTSGCVVEVWICEGDGTDRIALDYFRSQGVAGLVGLRRGTLYRLFLSESDPVKARELADDIVVSRSRHHGLLMNPHLHTAEILSVQQVPANAEAR